MATWVRSEQDLTWLAPGTPPPLTARKVLAWRNEFCSPQVLIAEDEPVPCGYCELNRMRSNPARYWLGHVILKPSHRGQGIGRLLVELLLRQAFAERNAAGVSLVVFPDNAAAIACYERCGFVVTRQEHHQFKRTGQRHRLLRMELDRRRWLERSQRSDSSTGREG